MNDPSSLDFPKNFLWGSAMSSHQVEGDNTNDWTAWEKSPRRLKHLHQKGHIVKYGLENFLSRTAANHYHLYKEDYALAKELGHNALRISLEWSRVEPEEGKFDDKALEKYRTMIKEMRAQGIEPLVTLWHWTVPLWFRDKGGWQSREASELFRRYVDYVVTVLQHDVAVWITLNEPEIYTIQSYLSGAWPPQKKNPFAYLRVFAHLITAHRVAYTTIKRITPSAQVGIAKNNIYFEAHRNHFVNVLFKRAADWWWNFYFLNRIVQYQDFIGLNYYFHSRIHFGFDKNENKATSDLGWELHPEGIYHVLRDLKRYNKPIYITENGLADATDKKRAWFIVSMLKYVHQALVEGVDVRGYLHWSLLDNFEWDKGFFPRFGLVKIDYATQKRKPRSSAYLYAEIAKKNHLDQSIILEHRVEP